MLEIFLGHIPGVLDRFISWIFDYSWTLCNRSDRPSVLELASFKSPGISVVLDQRLTLNWVFPLFRQALNFRLSISSSGSSHLLLFILCLNTKIFSCDETCTLPILHRVHMIKNDFGQSDIAISCLYPRRKILSIALHSSCTTTFTCTG